MSGGHDVGRPEAGTQGMSRPRPRRIWQIPAVRAALIQVATLPLMLICDAVLASQGVALTVFQAAFLQGGGAALLTLASGLRAWWVLIQAAFPVALIAALSLHLSPNIFLATFLVLLTLYWSTFRTQVPFYPSGAATWAAVLAELPAGRSIRFVDAGSGLGGLVLHLAQARPESHFLGVESAPLPWAISVLRQRLCGNPAARFVRSDYAGLNWETQDVVFVYLSPAAMPGVWEKAQAEMRKGALLLSFEFRIPGVEPHFVRYPTEGGPALYGWRM